jgi:hypothetical protein
MTWFSIIKNPKLRTSSKITTNLGTSEKEEDDECRKKIQEYLNRIKSMGSPNISVYVDDSELDSFTEKQLCIILRQINKINVNNLKLTNWSGTSGNKYRQETDSNYRDNSLVVWSVLYLNENAFEHSATWYLRCNNRLKKKSITINISANAHELGVREALKAVDFR